MDSDQLRGFYQGQHVAQCPLCQKALEEELNKIISGCPIFRKQVKDMHGN